MNFVETFQDVCLQNGFQFTYGTPNIVNLSNDKVFSRDTTSVLLYSPIRLVPILNGYNVIEARNFEGSFLLVREGNISKAVFNENNHDSNRSEYAQTIVPMYDDSEVILLGLNACRGFGVTKWEITEAFNLFDKPVNILKVDFRITIE